MLFRPEVVASVALALSSYLVPVLSFPIDGHAELEVRSELDPLFFLDERDDLESRDDACDTGSSSTTTSSTTSTSVSSTASPTSTTSTTSSSSSTSSSSTSASSTSTSTTSASTSTTSASSTTSTTSASTTSVSSTTSTTSSTSTTTTAAPTTLPTGKVAVWWGQHKDTDLKTVCADPSYDVVAIAFVTYLNFNNTGYPAMNLGFFSWAATKAQTDAGASGLLDASYLAVDVAACQAAGKKVLMSLGGDASLSNVLFPDVAAAHKAANTLWNLFLGGTDNPAIRPFGPTVVLDGLDLDNEGVNSNFYVDFITTLRSLFATNPARKYYLSGAPQCPLPSVSLPAVDVRLLDYVFVTFYNNPVCNADGTGFTSSVAAWSTLLQGSNAKLFIGLPASTAAAVNGYVTPTQMSTLVHGVRKSTPNLGGVALWDAAFAFTNGNYQVAVKKAITD